MKFQHAPEINGTEHVDIVHEEGLFGVVGIS